MKFIYVYDTKARDELLDMGLRLMKSDDRNNIYVFMNPDRLDFARLDFSYILSDTLTF